MIIINNQDILTTIFNLYNDMTLFPVCRSGWTVYSHDSSSLGKLEDVLEQERVGLDAIRVGRTVIKFDKHVDNGLRILS